MSNIQVSFRIFCTPTNTFAHIFSYTHVWHREANPYFSCDRLFPAAPDVPQCLTNDHLCSLVNPALPFLSRGKTPLKRLFPLTWRPLVQFRNTTRGNKFLCPPRLLLRPFFFSCHRPVHPIAPPRRATPSAETNQPPTSSHQRSWRATLWGYISICLRYWSLLRKVLCGEKQSKRF